MAIRIGITGGIASGKSKCLSYLASKSNVYALNLDLVAFEVYDRNPRVIRNLQNSFGQNVFENGKINRVYLSAAAFRD